MGDLDQLRNSVAGTLKRAKDREVVVHGRELTSGAGSADRAPAKRDNSARVELAIARHKELTEADRKTLKMLRGECAEAEAAISRARRSRDEIEQRIDVTGMMMELTRHRRQELDEQLAGANQEMGSCLAERQKATLTVLETHQAVERLAARVRTRE